MSNKTGRTTRLADELIQKLFKDKEITIKDHKDKYSNHEHLWCIIMNRLLAEHKNVDVYHHRTNLYIKISPLKSELPQRYDLESENLEPD